MIRLLRHLLVIAAAAMIIPSAEAGILASWSFDNSWTGGTNATIGATGIVSPFSTGTLVAGVPVVKDPPTISRTVLSGSDYTLTFSSGSGKNASLDGCYFILKVTASSSFSSAFTINYSARISGNAAAPVDTWEYSLNGGTSWTSFGTNTIANGTTFTAASVTTGKLTVGTTSGIWFRDTLSGSPNRGQSGTADFNNISISGVPVVPEPAHYALAVFGLIFAGARAGRWYRMKRATGI